MNEKDQFSHFSPSHFFDPGPYEVWASKDRNPEDISLIAAGLCLETAKAFNWPHKEIRLSQPPSDKVGDL